MELDCAQLLILVPGVVTAIWAIVTFTLQWQAKQREEQKRISALYTNPFMLACQELQSRLYNILKKGGLGALNAQDRGNHSHADETIYLVAQYFGWERYMFRYSPYARDPEVMTEVVRQVDKPCLGFKILAAGRKCGRPESVREAFRFAFEHIKPTDGVIVGMYPRFEDEISANVRSTLEFAQPS